MSSPDTIGAEAPRPAFTSRWTGLFLGIAFLGAALIRPRLPFNSAPGDVFLAPLAVLGLIGAARDRHSPVRAGGRRALPFLWLIALGSLLGLTGVGLAPWAVEAMIKDVYVLLIFAGSWHVLWRHRNGLESTVGLQLLGLTMMCAFAIATGHGESRLVPNPNLVGSYLAFIGLGVFISSRRNTVRLAALAIASVGVAATGSIGGATALGAGMAAVAYYTWRSAQPQARLVMITSAPIVAIPAAAFVYWTFERTGREVGDAIDSKTGSRVEIWGDALSSWVENPLGAGPGGLVGRGYSRSAHNDLIEYLTERGLLGLIGLVGFLAVLAFFGTARHRTRVVLFAAIVGGMSHETLHFRHLWLVLAMALVADHVETERENPPESLAQQRKLTTYRT